MKNRYSRLWQDDELGVDLEHAVLFLTHLHSDHTGQVEYFASRGVLIYMSRVDYSYLERILLGEHWSQLERWFFCEGFPDEALELQAQGN